jgi:hypothetical protein
MQFCPTLLITEPSRVTRAALAKALPWLDETEVSWLVGITNNLDCPEFEVAGRVAAIAGQSFGAFAINEVLWAVREAMA